jgi:Family of unknown function (DUF5336)
MMSYVAALLGVLMFIWGFLKWLEIGDGDDKQKYAGFAFGTPTSAVIGFSLAAGLMALLGATERRSGRGVPSAIPTALAATSLLLAIGILIAKDSISPDGGADVGAKIGLILGLITALLQTVVLAATLASRKDDAANTAAPFQGQSSGGAPGYGGPQDGATTGYGAPQTGGTPGYGAPQSTGPTQTGGTPGY